MSQQMQSIPVSQQVHQFTQQVTALFIRRERLTSELDGVNEQLRALQNVIAGVELGKQLAAEVAAESANAKQPPSPKEPS